MKKQRYLLHFLFVLIVFLSFKFPVYSQSPVISPNQKVDTIASGSPFNVYEYQVGSDNSGNVFYVWFEAIYATPTSDRIMFRKSTDFGVTFSSQPVPIPFTPAPNGLGYFKMVNDQSGHIYVTWVHYIGFSSGDREIYTNHSTDYGQTWQSTDTRIDNGSNKNIPSIEVLTCDNNGHVYVTWMDSRTNNYHVYFNSSSNYGVTWQSSDILLDTTSNDNAGPPVMCSDKNGNIDVVWLDYRLSKYRLFSNYSTNYGTSWQNQNVRVDNDNTSAYYPFGDYEVACDLVGNIYTDWLTNATGVWNVNFNRSTNHGTSWNTIDTRIDHSPSGTHVNPISIYADSAGYVYGMWNYGISPDINASKTFFNYSSNFGVTWQANDQRIDNAPSNYHAHYANIASDNKGDLYVVWQQEPYCSPPCVNAQVIYMNYSQNHGASWASNAYDIDDAPGNTSQDLPIITCNRSGNFFASWKDNRNNPVVGSPTIDYYSVKVTINPLSVLQDQKNIPDNFALFQNFPNPFNPLTKIKFNIPLSRGVPEGRGVFTALKIYDILGHEVATLVNEKLIPGTYEVTWDASNFPSGVYFYKLTALEPETSSGLYFTETKKLVLIK